MSNRISTSYIGKDLNVFGANYISFASPICELKNARNGYEHVWIVLLYYIEFLEIYLFRLQITCDRT
ncbi:hypothetical protein L596_002744 [Steinernema carpocapsae]|uniref:Uncharacterized protein n=1 Tax=Steinernema carpocapsae TaxID=34508 RepID=A0A4U8UR11_STECR|nr:hypothetical protein L596_002744 [Steinernema carpocapsae]